MSLSLRRRVLFGFVGTLLLILVAGVGLETWRDHAARRPDPLDSAPFAKVSFALLKDVPVYRPAGNAPPRAIVLHFGDGDTAIPSALVREGAAVLMIDTQDYLKLITADVLSDNSDCIYEAGDLGDLAKEAERALGLTTYLQPIFSGEGEGASLAWAAFADAPANSLTGAIGTGFDNRLSLPLPFCPGPPTRRTHAGRWEHMLDFPLEGKAVLFAPAHKVPGFKDEANGNPDLTIETESGDPAEQMAAALDRLAPPGAGQTLPAVTLPAQTTDGKPTTPRALAVIYSGDGGWRDLDMSIGEVLQKEGITVIGVDSLRYFWSKRPPAQIAGDLARLIAVADPEGKLPLMLAGYSFGADTLPFAVPLLPEALRERVKLTALLAPGRRTDFRIHVDGWLGVESGDADIVSAIAKLDPATTLCVWGEEEGQDDACSDPKLAGMPQIKTKGGHHFGGDYQSLAADLVKKLGS